jgi:glycerol kinase
MKKKYIIAFDQGTTSTRTIIFDTQGAIHGISQKELTQHYPQSGWVEHDPNQIYNDQQQTLTTVLKDTGIDPHDIAGIGITNQRETVVVWDTVTGEPIYNAIVWLDNRTTAICNQLKDEGLAPYVRENTGLVIDSYFSGTKLKWILDHVDGAQQKAAQGTLAFGTIDSWLIYKFTKEKHHYTDHTNASRTMLYNIKTLQWDDTLLSALGIPKSMCPEVKTSAAHFGYISYDGVDIPIYGVAGDQQAALFGQGGFTEGIAKNTYGTGCFLLLNNGEDYVTSHHGLITTLACSLPNQAQHYALEGSVFIGGASVQWLRDRMQLINHAKDTEHICTSIPPLEDVYVVPAFAGLGAPYWDANAKGAIYGLTLDIGKNEIIKATVEALAYQTTDVLKAMEDDSGKQISALKVDGGASANNYLMQFQSDITNIPVDRPKIIETTALGAAMLAGLKAGVWTMKELHAIRDIDTLFEPQMKAAMRTAKYSGWLAAVKRTQTTTEA